MLSRPEYAVIWRHIVLLAIAYFPQLSLENVVAQEHMAIYLVQAEQYMDVSHLQSRRTQAMLVTWMQPPPDGLSHYAFFLPNSTWVERRNFLYREMFSRFGVADTAVAHPFLYIVMMDGDVTLTRKGATQKDAFRTFESYLSMHLPAVGVPCLTGSNLESISEVQGVVKFDQRLVAFHKSAAPLLLPYADLDSVEQSGAVQNALSVVAYPDSCLQFNTVCIRSDGSKRSKSVDEAYDWIASAALHLVDYLNILKLKKCEDPRLPPSTDEEAAGQQCNLPDHSDAREKRIPQTTTKTYLVHGRDGLFDLCHPFFESKVSYYCDLSALDVNLCQLRPEIYSFNGLVVCAGTGTVFDQRQKERHFLFIQELGTKLRDLKFLLASPEKNLEDWSYKTSPGRDVQIKLIYPQNNTCVRLNAEADWVTLQFEVYHDLAWRPEMSFWDFKTQIQLTTNEMLLEEYSLEMRPTPCSSAVGMPPVHWYESSSGVAINRFHLAIPGVQSGATRLKISHKVAALRPDLELWQDVPDSERSEVIDVHLDSRFIAAVNNDTCTGISQSAHIRDAPLPRNFSIIYLVQHDACMDLSHLKSAHSEVLLLTWRTLPGDRCPGAIYFPDSTLVQGRNRLYREMLDRYADDSPAGHPFTYIVIMDGDSRLIEAADFGQNTGDPWRTFETYLDLYKPAVGVPHFGDCDYESAVEVQLVFNFDQIVVAYHAEAAPLLLPYVELFDNVSWWYCGAVQNALCSAAYNEHRMQFNALKVLSFRSEGVSGGKSKYKRGSSFGQALRWIATSFSDIDAVLRIPWANCYQSAALGDRSNLDLEGRPFPKMKGNRHYGTGLAHMFDYCHDYFLEKNDSRFVCARVAKAKDENDHIRHHLSRLGNEFKSMDALANGFYSSSSDIVQPQSDLITNGYRYKGIASELRKLQALLSAWLIEMAMIADNSTPKGDSAPATAKNRCSIFTPPALYRKIVAKSLTDLRRPAETISAESNKEWSIDDLQDAASHATRESPSTIELSDRMLTCTVESPANMSVLMLSSDMKLLTSYSGVVALCKLVNVDQMVGDCSVKIQIGNIQSAVQSCQVLMTSHDLHQHMTIQFNLTRLLPGLNQMRLKFMVGSVASNKLSLILLARNFEVHPNECIPDVGVQLQQVYRLPSLQYVSSLQNRLVNTHVVRIFPEVLGCQGTPQLELRFSSVRNSSSQLSEVIAVSSSLDENAELGFDDYGIWLVEMDVLSTDVGHRLLSSKLLVFNLQPTPVKKKFCYLIQAPELVHMPHLKTSLSEVIQLIWRNWEDDWSREAIYFPNSTLVQGRNRLFEEVSVRFPETEFLYLVFLDDDVDLVECKDFGHNTGNGWRTFERYLLDWEPAVGVPSYRGWQPKLEHQVQSVFAFDQIVVAYHWETWPLLLPYTEVFDHQSWWYCATVQHALCHIFYRDSTVMFNAVEAVNAQHRYAGDYKRQRAFEIPLGWIAAAFVDFDAVSDLPFDEPTRSYDNGVAKRRAPASQYEYFSVNPTVDMRTLRPRRGGQALRRLAYVPQHPYFAQRPLLHPYGIVGPAAAADTGACLPAERVLLYLASLAQKIRTLEQAVLAGKA